MKKIVKIVVIIIVLGMIIFCLDFIRKYRIVKSVQEKYSKYESSMNFYYREESNNINLNEKYKEIYFKDGIEKYVMVSMQDYVVTEFRKEKVLTRYSVTPEGKKTVGYDTNSNVFYPFNTYLNFDSKQDEFNNILKCSIKTEKLNGKKYYVISNMPIFSMLSMVEFDTKIKLYINCNTGLVEKRIDILASGEKYTTIFKYEFGVITEEDLEEPDKTDYEIFNYTHQTDNSVWEQYEKEKENKNKEKIIFSIC